MPEGNVFLWLGIFLISSVLAFITYQDYRLFFRPHKRTIGKVVDYHQHSDADGMNYSPKVSFYTEDGRCFEITDNWSFSAPKPKIGSNLNVIYPPDAPDQGRVSHPYLRAFLYIVMIGMLVALLGRALGFLSSSGEF